MEESQLLRWLAGSGVISALLIGAVIGPRIAADRGHGAGMSALAGVAAFGGSALVTAVVGLFMGAFVHLSDVPGDPGFARALGYGLIGFLLGGACGAPAGALGGLLGWPFTGRRGP